MKNDELYVLNQFEVVEVKELPPVAYQGIFEGSELHVVFNLRNTGTPNELEISVIRPVPPEKHLLDVIPSYLWERKLALRFETTWEHFNELTWQRTPRNTFWVIVR